MKPIKFSTKLFPKEYLIKLATDSDEVYKELIDITEWTAEYRLIFRDGDKYYSCYYSEGLNDQVDIHPFDNEKDFIKCFEVMKKTIMVEDWVDVFEE